MSLRLAPHELALFVLAGLALASQASPTLALINETPSLPPGLYLRSFGGQIDRGAVVAVHTPSAAQAYLRARGAPANLLLLKHVAGVAGDHVCASPTLVQIAEHQLPVRRRDRHGAALPVWRRCGPLAAGEIFLAGDSLDSFDSRYFGPVRRDQVVGVFRAVMTW